jgi:hypothetical protein
MISGLGAREHYHIYHKTLLLCAGTLEYAQSYADLLKVVASITQTKHTVM